MSLKGHSRLSWPVLPASRRPLCSESDRINARQRNDAKGQKQTHALRQEYAIRSARRRK